MVAVIATDADFEALAAARKRLGDAVDARRSCSSSPRPAGARCRRPAGSGCWRRRSPPVLGGARRRARSAAADRRRQPAAARSASSRFMVEEARRRGPARTRRRPRSSCRRPSARPATLAPARALTARAGQMLLFLLTMLLAGMLLSQLIEEKVEQDHRGSRRGGSDRRHVPRQAVRDAGDVAARHRRVDRGGRGGDRPVDGRRPGRRSGPGGRLAGVPRPRGDLFRDELSAARLGVPRHRRPGLDGARGADPVDAGDHGAGGDLRVRRDRASASPTARRRWPPRSSPCPRRS